VRDGVGWRRVPLATIEAPERTRRMSLDELLTTVLYPALYDRPIGAADWHASYLATYVERDVRQLSRVADLLQFQRFMRLMAARCGQLLMRQRPSTASRQTGWLRCPVRQK
jgi:predicted AAA+ superfamily ATPase